MQSSPFAVNKTCCSLDVNVVQTCLELGARNDPHPTFGQTALQAAVNHGHLRVAKVLLDEAAYSEVFETAANLGLIPRS